MADTHAELLRLQDLLTTRLLAAPYNPLLYVARARAHLALAFPDLAAGDAYRGLLLIDNVNEALDFNPDEDWVDEEIEEEIRIGNLALSSLNECLGSPTEKQAKVVASVEQQCIHLLAGSLFKCGAHRDARVYAAKGAKRYGNAEVAEDILPAELKSNAKLGLANFSDMVAELDGLKEKAEAATSRRVLYAWNRYEPDRFSRETVDHINTHIMAKASDACAVDVVDLPLLSTDGSSETLTTKHLGVFATKDVADGEQFLREESVLTVVVDPVGGGLCEYCGTKCFASDAEESTRGMVLKLPGQEKKKAVDASNDPQVKDKSDLFACSTCLLPSDDDAEENEYDSEDEYDDSAIVPTFCSQHCLVAAQENYHNIFCRNRKLTPIYHAIKQTLTRPSTSASGAGVYALLLLKSFALALNRNVHPLLLEETRYLYGVPPTDTTQKEDLTLGWSFEENILRPIRILESMKIDIYTGKSPLNEAADSEWWAPWVVNTLIAKFRGVASGRMGNDGKTEAAAAHTLFSLTNHDCTPNVKWSCSGIMKFYGTNGGFKKGEELKISYCDTGLGYKERREWMEGCLGGHCLCERCLKEEREDQEKVVKKVESLKI